jgi:hypothetical protein
VKLPVRSTAKTARKTTWRRRGLGFGSSDMGRAMLAH